MSKPSLPWEDNDSGAPVGGETERDLLSDGRVPPEQIPSIDLLTPTQAEQVADTMEQAAAAAITAQAQGQEVIVSTVNMSGQKLKIADAKSRAYRTLMQNLGVDILVALGTVLPMLLNMRFDDPAAWAVFGTSVAKTVVAVFVSYVTRLTVEPVIPTPIEVSPGTVVQPVPNLGRSNRAEG